MNLMGRRWMYGEAHMENGEKLLIEKLIRSFADYTWLVMPRETMRRKGIYISCETVCSVRQSEKTSHRRGFIQTMSLDMSAEIENENDISIFLFWDSISSLMKFKRDLMSRIWIFHENILKSLQKTQYILGETFITSSVGTKYSPSFKPPSKS